MERATKGELRAPALSGWLWDPDEPVGFRGMDLRRIRDMTDAELRSGISRNGRMNSGEIDEAIRAWARAGIRMEDWQRLDEMRMRVILEAAGQ